MLAIHSMENQPIFDHLSIETTQYCPYNAITIDLPKETTSLLRPLSTAPTMLPKETTSLLRPLSTVPYNAITIDFNFHIETTSLLRPSPLY